MASNNANGEDGMIQRGFCHTPILLWIGCVCVAVHGQDTAENSIDDTTMIEAAIQSYVAAFNERNAEKLAAHWAPEGVYTSRTSGERVTGRDAMLKEFQSLFASDASPKLAVETESIEFISPSVALERGSATVTNGEDDASQTEYRVVYVKRDGEWLIDRVTEEPLASTTLQYEQLKEIEWLVGDWSYEDEGFRMELSCQWTTNQNFISRKYKMIVDGEITSSGLQLIGWDEKAKTIRSWLFDSDGGVVTGKWTKRENRWVVQSTATLADGGSGSFTSIFELLDDGNCQWEKINRVIDGKLLPNIDEIILQRN